MPVTPVWGWTGEHRDLLIARPEPSLARNPVEKNSVEKDRSRALGHLLAFSHTCAYITCAFTLTHKHSLKREKGNFFIIVLIFIQFPLSVESQNLKK